MKQENNIQKKTFQNSLSWHMECNYTDNELLELIKSSTNINYSFGILVKAYQKKIYWHIRRMVVDHDDANDLTQETFIKVWKNISNFKGESALYTWIYKIATNECLGFLRKQKIRSFFSFSDIESKLADKLIVDPYFTGDALQKKLHLAILTLPEKQRIVFNMRYFEGIKYEDMAKILNTSEGALKASYHIASKKIEKILVSN